MVLQGFHSLPPFNPYRNTVHKVLLSLTLNEGRHQSLEIFRSLPKLTARMCEAGIPNQVCLSSEQELLIVVLEFLVKWLNK